MDLVLFGAFLLVTLIGVPLGAVTVLTVYDPELDITKLTGIQTVLITALWDLLLVGGIVFLTKVVHGQPFLKSMHWSREHGIPIGFLIALGAVMAVGVLIVTSLFPPSQPPPIEELLSSREALVAFAIFGIGIAPLLEEILFRGFLYGVFQDLLGKSVAIPATAVLFTLVHVPQLLGSWAGVAMILVVGSVLSLARAKSNSLIPSFIIHTAYNGMLFALGAVGMLVESGQTAAQ